MSVTVDAMSVELDHPAAAATPPAPAAAAAPVAHATPYAADAPHQAAPPHEAAPPQAAATAQTKEAAAEDLVVTWRSISACHARTCAVLERELGERHGLGISDFEVLARLSEAAEHKYRAQDLAEAVHLSQSALSRLVDRLARNGLVQRYTCDMDRRGIYVQLTEAGQQRYAQARPDHLDILRRTLPGDLIH